MSNPPSLLAQICLLSVQWYIYYIWLQGIGVIQVCLHVTVIGYAARQESELVLRVKWQNTKAWITKRIPHLHQNLAYWRKKIVNETSKNNTSVVLSYILPLSLVALSLKFYSSLEIYYFILIPLFYSLIFELHHFAYFQFFILFSILVLCVGVCVCPIEVFQFYVSVLLCICVVFFFFFNSCQKLWFQHPVHLIDSLEMKTNQIKKKIPVRYKHLFLLKNILVSLGGFFTLQAIRKKNQKTLSNIWKIQRLTVRARQGHLKTPVLTLQRCSVWYKINPFHQTTGYSFAEYTGLVVVNTDA